MIPNALSRSEFLEILVRTAKVKYLERGKCKSLPEALQALIDHFTLEDLE